MSYMCIDLSRFDSLARGFIFPLLYVSRSIFNFLMCLFYRCVSIAFCSDEALSLINNLDAFFIQFVAFSMGPVRFLTTGASLGQSPAFAGR